MRNGIEDERKRHAEILANERVKAEAARQEEKNRAGELVRAAEAKLAQFVDRKATEAPEGTKIPEISRLVSGVSQQIMSPLSAVLNQLKLIKIKLTQGSGLKPEEFKDTVNLIEENALLCKGILASLADPQRGLKGVSQLVSLNDLISRISGLIGQELKLQNISFQKLLQVNLADIGRSAAAYPVDL